jgi:hypothetical protein
MYLQLPSFNVKQLFSAFSAINTTAVDTALTDVAMAQLRVAAKSNGTSGVRVTKVVPGRSRICVE